MNTFRPNMALWDVLSDWQESNPRVRSNETVRLMESSLRRFEEYIGRRTFISDLTEKNVTQFLRKREADGMAPNTVEREGNKVCTLWRWAAKRDWARDPLITIRKASPRTPVAWTPREIKKLILAAEAYTPCFKYSPDTDATGMTRDVVRIPGYLIMGVLIRLLFETGERLGATVRLTWSDIDTTHRFVNIRSEYRKGKQHDNQQRISRKTRWHLERLREFCKAHEIKNPDDAIFPPKKNGNYHYHLRAIFRTADIPYAKRTGFHQIRRSHATALYVAGGDPTYSLGHESTQMTREHYLDPRYVRPFHSSDMLTGGIGFAVRRLFRRIKVALGIW